MNIQLVTKSGSDGQSIIDRDKSFMALIEALEPIYERMFGDGGISHDIAIRGVESFRSLVDEILSEKDEGSNESDEANVRERAFTLISLPIFTLVDSEQRDVKRAAEMLAAMEEVYPCGEAYLILGILHYCAPNGMTQNKALALDMLQKARGMNSIFGGDPGEVVESANSAIELISKAMDRTSSAISKIDLLNSSAVGVHKANYDLNNKAAEKRGGVWAVVINVALNAVSAISADKLNDPVFMRKALSKAYELLPFWVRMAVSEEVFFNFCFDRRALLINKLGSGRSGLDSDEVDYLLPADDQQPQISKETLLINIVDRHSGSLFSEDRFYFFPNTGSEKFVNAYNSYVKEALDRFGISGSGGQGILDRALRSVGVSKDLLPEEVGVPLLMYDCSAFGNCKVGFVVTTKMFIVKEMMEKPTLIRLSQIKSFEVKKSFLSAGKIFINNEAIIDCNQGKKDSFQKFSNMFLEIVGSL